MNLWLIDRSGMESGRGHCPRARFLLRHAGPTGYGWVRRPLSVPSLTGGFIHDPIATILRTVQAQGGQYPAPGVVQAAIDEATTRYAKLVATRGLSAVDPDQTKLRVLEQLTLLAGLVWTWYQCALPVLLADHEIVSLEEEDVTVVGCTCGLGELAGTAEQHDARDCRGIGWMTRADLITRTRGGDAYAYHEIKTTAQATMNWEMQWQHRPQLIAGVLGAEQRLGVTIDAVYIHALIKGKYAPAYNQETGSYTGPSYQQSRLVYGYRRPGNLPLYDESWAAKTKYIDATGKSRRLGEAYQRTPVWEYPQTLWGDALSASHAWAGVLAPLGLLEQQYRCIGPIYRRTGDGYDRRAEFLTQLVAEERQWQDTLWTLYQQGGTWGDPAFMSILDQRVWQNRGDACQSYFGETCSYLPLCNRVPGWQSPELLGFIPRRPHHAPELAQAIERGLLPTDDPDATGEGEE